MRGVVNVTERGVVNVTERGVVNVAERGVANVTERGVVNVAERGVVNVTERGVNVTERGGSYWVATFTFRTNFYMAIAILYMPKFYYCLHNFRRLCLKIS